MKTDKREEKSIARIHEALKVLLTEKDFADINCSDIIARAGVARSTFYAHYEGKDDVLAEIATSIFAHVFSVAQSKEAHHDFSDASIFDYRRVIEHIFYHLDEDKALLRSVLQSSGRNLFLTRLEKPIGGLCSALYEMPCIPKGAVPKEFKITQMRDGLISLMKTAILEDRNESPKQMTDYFFALQGAEH